MVIYIDILFSLNLIITYFLLRSVTLIEKSKPSLKRMLLGCVVGAVFSAAIFFPPMNFLFETALKLIFSAAIIFAVFGFKNRRIFAKRVALFFAVSFIYAGIMLGVWFCLKPKSMAINNQVVYFGISPVLLIALTAVCYCIIKLILMLAKKPKPLSNIYTVEITMGNKTVSAQALLDTGNSLRDIYAGNSVIIANKSLAEKILPEACVFAMSNANGDLPSGFRLLPYSAINSQIGFLPAFKADRIKIIQNEKSYCSTDITIAVSNGDLDCEYKAVIGEDLAGLVE